MLLGRAQVGRFGSTQASITLKELLGLSNLCVSRRKSTKQVKTNKGHERWEGGGGGRKNGMERGVREGMIERKKKEGGKKEGSEDRMDGRREGN